MAKNRTHHRRIKRIRQGYRLVVQEEGLERRGDHASPENAKSWTGPAGLFTPRLDVTDRVSMQAAIDGTVAKFGGIDVLINNAGFGLLGPLEGASPDDLRREIDTNLMGVIGMIQLVLPLMREARSGVIVNVSSIGGRMTLPLFSAYHATKFAVEGLTEALQYELEGHGIRVKLVEPGGSKTNFDSSTNMVRTPHPAYKALIDGFDKMWEKESAKLPGPDKVVQAIYRAATDGSARLRYPVLAFPFLNLRNLVGARGWSAIMKMMVRRMG